MTFDFYIGGYFHDHSYRIILKNNVLSISDYVDMPIPEHDKKICVEGSIEWLRLLAFLKCCNWKRRYDSVIMDGTQWEIEAYNDDIRVKSYGSNAYPDDFEQFLKMLNKVIRPAGVSIKV